jgi:predicted transcriptional regulator
MSPKGRQPRTGRGEAPTLPTAESEQMERKTPEQKWKDTLVTIWEDGKQFGAADPTLEARLRVFLEGNKEIPARLEEIAYDWANDKENHTLTDEIKIAHLNRLDQFLEQQPDPTLDTKTTVPDSEDDDLWDEDDDYLWPDTQNADPYGMGDAEDVDDDPTLPPAPTAPPTGTTPDAGTVVPPETDTVDTAAETQENGSEEEEEEEEEDQEPGEEKKGFFATTHAKFRNGPLANFYRRFVGEKMPEDEKDFQADTKSNIKKLGRTGATVAGSVFGLKSFYDVPALITQEIATKLARKNITEALRTTEANFDKEGRMGGETVLTEKVKAVTEAILDSNYLTKKQKEELTKSIEAKIRGAEMHRMEIRKQRDQEIADLLNEAIQTRVSRQEALKQTLNTALKFSGYGFARGAVYGTMSAYERYKKISAEAAEDGLEKTYFNRFVVDGVKDTFNKMSGGNAETWQGRAANMISGGMDAARPFLIAYGIGSEMLDDASDAFDALMEKYESENRELGKTLLDAVFPGAQAAELPDGETLAPDLSETVDTNNIKALEATPSTTADINTEATTIDTPTQEAPIPGGAVDAVPEPSPTPEAPPEPTLDTIEGAFEGQKELALTKKEDGIVKMINRQLRENPKAFGFEGDLNNRGEVNAWVQKTSMEAARTQELIRTGGDTRLTEDAIGRLTVMAQAKEGGGIKINFFDGETKMSPAELEAQGLTYEGGTRPGIVATNAEATLRQPDRIEADTEVFQDSEAPNRFAAGSLWLEKEGDTLTAVRFKEGMEMRDPSAVYDSINMEAMRDLYKETSTEIWTGHVEHLPETNQDLVATYAIIQQLEKDGLGEGPEAQALRELLASQLRIFDHQTKGIDVFNDATIDAMRQEAAELAEPTGTGIEDGTIRVRGLGTIEITDGDPPINLDDITSNFGPMFEKKAAAIMMDGWETKLMEAGLEHDAVKAAERTALRISLMNSSLNELEAAGFGDAPEAQLIRKALSKELQLVGSFVNEDNEIMASAFKHAEKAGFDRDNMMPLDLKEDVPEAPQQPPQARTTPQPLVTTGGGGGGELQSTPGGQIDIRGEGGRFERGVYKTDSGKITFSYDKHGNVDGITMKSRFFGQDGSPFSAMPILEEEGVTHREVVNFDLNRRQTDFDFDVFERNIVRLERQQELLADMKADGLEGTPEYKALTRMNARGEAEKSMWISMIKAAREPSPGAVERAQRQAALEAQAFAERRQAIAEGTGT